MKTGRQEPTFKRVGEYDYSDGGDIADMFEEDAGATFYQAQREELILMLARNKDGSPAAQTIGISKPRQNGKSYAARYYAIYMADFEHRSVLYSAHHSSTTKKMFDAMCDIVETPERFPEFAADVKRITRGRGYEGIYFRDWRDKNGRMHDGGKIEFSTRTNAGARGGTYSVIIVDEAQELTVEQQEGLLPVISAASDVKEKRELPQQIYIGTPPAPTCNGTVFRDMHDTAHKKEPCALWWLEWSIENYNEVTRDNVLDFARETNPAMGYRIADETILNEFEQMQIDGFARERLGWWSPAAAERVEYALDRKVWDACASDEKKPEGKTAYGVKFSADGAEVVLCGAVCPKEGKARISFIDRQPTGKGTRWLAEWLNSRYEGASCVVIDGRNGADLLVERISETWKYKNSVIRPTARDVVAAVSTLTNELSEQTVTWFKDQEALKEAAISCVKRPLAGGWAFGGDNSAPVEACALALWGARNSKRDPNKKMLFG